MTKNQLGNTVGHVLTQLMESNAITPQELEKQTGVPSSTIYRLRSNKDVNPTLDSLHLLAKYFRIRISQLIGEEPLSARLIPWLLPEQISEYQRYLHDPPDMLMVDLQISDNTFATRVMTDVLEPFLPENSIIIVDPNKVLANKNYVIFIEANYRLPQVRQLLMDGPVKYLRAFNSQLPTQLLAEMKTPEHYAFFATIVQAITASPLM